MPSIAKRQNPLKSPGHTPSGAAFTRLLDQIIRLTRRFTAAGERLAKPAGQTLARWLVLEAIDEAPATVARVARDLALTRQSVQRVADLLERDGLAVYEDNPRHRRAKLLRPTPRGRAVLRDIQSRQRTWADALGKEVGQRDLRQASVVLDRVLVALERGRESDHGELDV